MASHSFVTSGFSPETDGEGISLDFTGVESLDVVKEAESALMQASPSFAQALRLKIGALVNHNTIQNQKRWQTKPEAAAARTLVNALQVATARSLKDPETFSTITAGPELSFSVMSPRGHLYSVLTTSKEAEPSLPSQFRVAQYLDYRAESLRSLSADEITPSREYSVSITSQDFALGSQMPQAENSEEHTRNMLTAAADLLER